MPTVNSVNLDLAASQQSESRQHNPNRVRDHLTNERTYLAWVRSAIAMMGFEVVIVRLWILRPPIAPPPGNGWKLGLLFSLIGLVTVLFSTQHYFSVCNRIDTDDYQPARRLIILFSSVILLLGIGVLYYVASIPFELPNDLAVE